MPEIKASPRKSGYGLFADVAQGLNDFASKPFGYDNPPGKMLMGLLGVPAVANTLNELAYGGALGTGSGMTWKPKADTVDAAMLLGGASTPLAAVRTTEAPAKAIIKEMTQAKSPGKTMRFDASQDFYDAVGVPPRSIFADVGALHNKHLDKFGSVNDVEAHVKHGLLGAPDYVLPASDPRYTLTVRNAAELPTIDGEEYRALITDFTGGRQGNYWVRSAFPMPEDQLLLKKTGKK